MNNLQRLTMAALAHDLPDLLASTTLTEPAGRILALADLSGQDELRTLCQQAEAYAAGLTDADSIPALITDQPLISIFSRLSLWRTDLPAAHYRRPAPLPATNQDQTAIFPTPDEVKDYPTLSSTHLDQLAVALDRLGQSLDPADDEATYYHLLHVLQQYGWSLPAHRPDVSFYDHARLTAAIAATLYRRLEVAGVWDEARVQRTVNEEAFCLLAGDLSGIQSYIFDITTLGPGGVARRLRARSFYLSAIADVISHQLTHLFELPLSNIIMASGGKFFLLLPNLPDLPQKVAAFRVGIDGWFQAEFNAELALNLAYEPFRGEQFQAASPGQPGFGDVLKSLSQKLNREKQRRGQSVLVDGNTWREDAFKLSSDFYGESVCDSCRKFPGSDDDGLCEQCRRQGELGRKLPRVEYVAYYRQPDLAVSDKTEMAMPDGYRVRVLTGAELGDCGSPYLVSRLNRPDLSPLINHPAAFRYLANHLPTDKYQVPLTFDKIAAQSEGRPLLGYLKADVDYLGILFAQGLRQDEGGWDTAAHIAGLSREMDLFFSGWVQHCLSQTEAYQHFYTIFSGGDDLFLVGPWDKALDLARHLNDNLHGFVAQNPEVTLSAGILLTKERYPIWRAAADAEQELEKSKERLWKDQDDQDQSRNQITFLDDTMRWEKLSAIQEEIAFMQKHAEPLRSAFLYDLITYSQLYRLWREEENVEGLRYKARFAYNIARNLRRGDKDLYNWADALLQSLNSQQVNTTMSHLGLIATYTLFSRRESGSNNDNQDEGVSHGR